MKAQYNLNMTKTMYEPNSVLKKQLKNIPSTAGIYMMLDKKGSVIYIGKALNLKNRVRSYFNVLSWKDRPKLSFMMPKVTEIRAVITRSEKEALILEATLVNKYQPKYNVTLKDDKKFPWLMITYDENYPRVLPIRDVAGFKKKFPDTKNKFFGPYSDSGAMWETYKVIKEGFQLRLRRKPLFKDRPCMNYHIGLCSGPCQKLISDNDYYRIVKQVEDFLLGKYTFVLKDLKQQMKEASRELQYERAAKLRDTIKKIENVLEKQIVVSDDPRLEQDVFACSSHEESMVLEVLLIREGKVISVESLSLKLPEGTDVKEAFADAIKQYYIRLEDEDIPSEIIVQFELLEREYIEEWLSSRLKRRVTVQCPKKGRKLELVKMASQNAKMTLQKILSSDVSATEVSPEQVLMQLKQELELKNVPRRIECFDISHLGGTGTVGSMVCFIDGKPEKSEYRKFKVKSLLQGEINDFQAIKEVIGRRYKTSELRPESSDLRAGAFDVEKSQVAGRSSKLPDLIIIDGGKGQLNAAKEALGLNKIDLEKVDLISIAKKLEEVFKSGRKDSIKLERKSQELFLLQRIRDESHRFAITFQREKRTKNVFENKLEDIPGLTKAKIKKLMNYFGSVKNIKESDLHTFTEVFGHDSSISKVIWEKIQQI